MSLRCLMRRRGPVPDLLLQRAFSPRCLPYVASSGATIHCRTACRHPHRHFVSFSYQSTGGGASRGDGSPSHYDILGVAPTCGPKDIRDGYLRKVKSCHPDLHGDAKTAEFQRLSLAYSVLSNRAKRAQYDANGFRDFEDFSDQEKAKEMFRQKMKAMWEKELTWKFVAMRVVPVYTLVYVLAHVVVFVIDIPVNMLMGVVRLCAGMLGG